MPIIVGSETYPKIIATIQGFSQAHRGGDVAGITGMDVCSEVNKQPVGLDETYRGALNRANAVKKKYPTAIAVGIESGIIMIGNDTFDIAIVIIIDENGGVSTATSQGLLVPRKFFERAEVQGLKWHTVGSAVAEELLGDPGDPHLTLTEGRISRVDFMAQAVFTALLMLPH